jgi:two-component system, OmpR family, osmolarity sensor histidine kinase EnvZ
MLAPREKLQRRTIGWRSLRRFLWERCAGLLADLAPKGLYARALIIIIAPIVLLESVVAFTFMERHWNQVTRRLSEAAARNIGAIVDLYSSRAYTDEGRLAELAQKRFGLTLTVMEPGELPKGGEAKPFFDLLDRALSEEIGTHLAQMPVWIDTVGQSRRIEIRVKLDDAILRFTAPRALAYASNSHIFLVWMVGTSVVLLTVAILFLRNQIRPILRLAEAADDIGKGRPVPQDFRPRGAREVRQAAHAFLEMRDRIRQHVEQRTTMLAGVGHDLRTVLTRFKLELALLGDRPEVAALQSDVNEMQRMLEDYLAFARGDDGEEATATSVRELLE